MNKIRKGDSVIVLTGRDKGKTGDVLQVLANDRALVNGINLVKKHTKPNPMSGTAGGIVEKEASIHISNIAIFNSKTNKADKVAIQVQDDKKVRVFKSDASKIDA
ncbi:MAG: 50S ribosomal protein L24 [Arenicella sp.]